MHLYLNIIAYLMVTFNRSMITNTLEKGGSAL